MRQTATSPRLSPETRVWLRPAASVRTGAWWQYSGGAASAMRPWGQTPDCHRRTSCVAAQNESAQPRPRALDWSETQTKQQGHVWLHVQKFLHLHRILRKPNQKVKSMLKLVAPSENNDIV